jgi:cytochrome d ubiquinol oxidase subunit I
MDLDPVMLSRIQFAVTIGFHFIFPPISIGLAWLLVIIEGVGWRKGDEVFVRAGKFFGKMLAITFVLGVATGIVMEFQFGTNWAEYSKFVGDIFGSPLAAEGIFAFFLESAFLGLYLFGRNRLSRGVHWFSILMVAVGSTISAFWILVANSWQQTPAGFIIQNNRAELTNFWEAVFNASMILRFSHTLVASIIAGAFFMAGISSYLILKKRGVDFAKRTLQLSIIVGLIFSVLELYPTGHEHTRQVASTQPEKFAALEGLYVGQRQAPLILFGLVDATPPPGIKAKIEIPGLLSWMAFGDIDAHVQGINEFSPDEIPPLWLPFVSFHNMVILGLYFIGVTALGVFFIYSKKLFNKKWFLKLMVISIPLPVAACEFGWVVAEVGRQPWVVYKVLRTSDAVSLTVSPGEILFSLILFGLIYLFLLVLYIFLLFREAKHAPELTTGKEAAA